MIFFHHYNGMFPAGGACGVSFFLMLSGFVMCAGYENKSRQHQIDFSKFMLKRIIRLYPLHLLCLLGFICLNILAINPGFILKLIPNLLLLQSWIPVQSIYFSGNAVSWCLSDLMFFYAIFPLLMTVLNNHRKLFILTLLGLLTIYIPIMYFIPEQYAHPILYINPLFRSIDFIIGISLWQLYRIIISKNRSCINRLYATIFEALALFSVCIGIYIYPDLAERYTLAAIWWIPMTLVILCFAYFNNRGGVFSQLLLWKPLILFGNASFSFYMIHVLGIQVCHAALKKLSLIEQVPLALPFTLITIIIASIIVYRYFEIPISNRLLQKFKLVK